MAESRRYENFGHSHSEGIASYDQIQVIELDRQVCLHAYNGSRHSIILNFVPCVIQSNTGSIQRKRLQVCSLFHQGGR